VAEGVIPPTLTAALFQGCFKCLMTTSAVVASILFFSQIYVLCLSRKILKVSIVNVFETMLDVQCKCMFSILRLQCAWSLQAMFIHRYHRDHFVQRTYGGKIVRMEGCMDASYMDACIHGGMNAVIWTHRPQTSTHSLFIKLVYLLYCGCLSSTTSH